MRYTELKKREREREGEGGREGEREREESEGERERGGGGRVCLLVACLTSQQQASVSQGRICSGNFTCCHTETDVADQTFLPHPVTVY